MQQASEGTALSELMEKLDIHLTYGGARKISEFEAELLDTIDESFDAQIKIQRDAKKAQKSLENTDDAINRYCSETTRKKILLERGWQFMREESQTILEEPSDKELVSRLKTENSEQKKQIEKLQAMLKKTLEFAVKVKDSVVGKIFFKKPIQELNIAEKTLPSLDEK